MKAHTHAITFTRCAAALAAFLLGACSTVIPGPGKNAVERHGQVKFSSPDEQIVGEIAIRHDADSFHAEITKGPGVPLLTISAKFGTKVNARTAMDKHMISAHLSGPLSKGGWTWKTHDLTKKNFSNDKLKDHSRAWVALPEVFMWGDAQAKGEAFQACLPDIAMHARAGNGQVKRFDYARHENPTGEALPIKDLRKQPKLESVICILD